MTEQVERILVWFSCGTSSAVALKLALDKYGSRVQAVYCDTSKNEHPDNMRFMRDVESWLGVKVEIIKSQKFTTVEEVFESRRFMGGVNGAPCTVELKKVPRFAYQRPGDTHIFGYAADEKRRIANFAAVNHDLALEWILRDQNIKKVNCFSILQKAGITPSQPYLEGFEHSNCIGCVKATSPTY